MRLITGEANRLPDRTAKMPDGVETEATLLWQAGAQNRYPWLDENLRELIGHMMAVDHANRPELKSTLKSTREVATRLRSADFPSAIKEEESAAAIIAFVQRFFLDAQES
ncbi:hypothetical protein PG991_014793 [Apiospora marii]|uniref:Protein kinase domain-containing protein n=2 Tax=Apiospora marii TaxID=335849 RepID=A0ABR1R4J2_9PEZI